MGKLGREEVLKIVREKNIKFIKFWFVDILGQLKSFTVTDSELEEAFTEGMGFDGSSIEGFARIYESDLVAIPDPSTFQILPWGLPEPSTIVVFSLSTVTLLARPRSSIVIFSSFTPRSSVIALPPVSTAISSSIALRRSP